MMPAYIGARPVCWVVQCWLHTIQVCTLKANEAKKVPLPWQAYRYRKLHGWLLSSNNNSGGVGFSLPIANPWGISILQFSAQGSRKRLSFLLYNWISVRYTTWIWWAILQLLILSVLLIRFMLYQQTQLRMSLYGTISVLCMAVSK